MTYPTTTDLKAWLSIDGAGEDTELGKVVNGVIGFVERYTGRVFVAAAGTRTFEADAPYVNRDRRRLNLLADLVSVTTLTNGDGNVLSSSDYTLYPQYGPPYYEIQLDRRGVKVFQDSVQAISLLGSWGFSSSCPAAVFEMILELCQFDYQALHSGSGGVNLIASRQTGLVVAPDAFPPRLREMLDQWRR